MRLWPHRRADRLQADADMDAHLWEAERALVDARQLHSRADEIADRLSKTRERNHFAAAVARALRGA